MISLLEKMLPANSRLRRLINEEAREQGECIAQGGFIDNIVNEPGSLTVVGPFAPGLEDLRVLLTLLEQAQEKLASLPRLVDPDNSRGQQWEEAAFTRMGECLKTAWQAVEYSVHMTECYGAQASLKEAVEFRAEQNYLLGIATLRQAEFFCQEGNENPPAGWQDGLQTTWKGVRLWNRISWTFSNNT